MTLGASAESCCVFDGVDVISESLSLFDDGFRL